MDRLPTFEEFLTTQATQINLGTFTLNLLIAAMLAGLLARIYNRFGSSLSNRVLFSRNFILITVTTMFIITVVKSSLALSLGLVGALSIVRFRAAIKEPEELAYLFLNIALGLGLGAGQTALTLLAFVLIVAILWWIHRSREPMLHRNLSLTVSNERPAGVELQRVADILQQRCASVALKRYDENAQRFEATFLVALDRFEDLTACRDALMALGEGMRITYLDAGSLAS